MKRRKHPIVRVALVLLSAGGAHGMALRGACVTALLAGIGAIAPVALAQSIEATAASMDAAWEKRAGMHSAIVAFVKSRPKLVDDYDVLWRMSRLCYYAGFFALPADGRKEDKLEIFKIGHETGDKARKLQPGRVEGHYWYAVNLGGWGINKGIMASLGSAEPMREALDEAVKLDARYHFAGPLRVRGRLYFKLPGGFVSFGDNKKALADLKKAMELGPESKLNYAYLAEVIDKLEGTAPALKLLEVAKKLPDVAGDQEEASYRRDIAELERKLK